MGIDIQLDSIHEPYVTNGIDAFVAGMERAFPHWKCPSACSGGRRARAATSAPGIMPGSDWYLSIEGVKALIEWTEARPITREMVESFADAIIDNDRKNPEPKVTHESWPEHIRQRISEPPTLAKDQAEVDRLYEWLSRKHDVLLAVLRKAVELNESPHFSG